MAARVGARVLRALAVLVLIGAAVLAFQLDLFGLRGVQELRRALTQRGRVAVVDGAGWLTLEPQGSELVSIDRLPAVAQALAGQDPRALREALEAAAVDVLMLKPGGERAKGASVGARLARYEHVPALRGLYLARAAALYVPDPVERLPLAQREATAVVARALIGGARPPRPTSFPEGLRHVRPVEVMVLLRHGPRPRLWRSARGSSIGTALVTAATVARQRWQEREQAMGSSLPDMLPRLDVEVALLEDDGTVADRSPAFIDRVFGPDHGVAYERKGAWRYLLPDATAREGKGRASRAYRKLFVDDGLPEDSFDRAELRLYRLLVRSLAVSPATPPKPDGLSDVHSPDEVLGASPP